jgi:ElaB/YqjD/DUF883 family membrane-anchored ribosome-binding protein
MAFATAETPTADRTRKAADSVSQIYSQTAQLAHEASRLKSLAADAIEDGVHAAKRRIKSVRRRVEELGDLKDEAIHRVKRQPALAVGAAFGLGVVLGVAVGWIVHQSRPRTREETAGFDA